MGGYGGLGGMGSYGSSYGGYGSSYGGSYGGYGSRLGKSIFMQPVLKVRQVQQQRERVISQWIPITLTSAHPKTAVCVFRFRENLLRRVV